MIEIKSLSAGNIYSWSLMPDVVSQNLGASFTQTQTSVFLEDHECCAVVIDALKARSRLQTGHVSFRVGENLASGSQSSDKWECLSACIRGLVFVCAWISVYECVCESSSVYSKSACVCTRIRQFLRAFEWVCFWGRVSERDSHKRSVIKYERVCTCVEWTSMSVWEFGRHKCACVCEREREIAGERERER